MQKLVQDWHKNASRQKMSRPGSGRLIDFEGLFRELKNIQYFNQAAVLDGTVVWPHEQDFCPDTLYLEAFSLQYAELKELREAKEQAAGQKSVPLHEVVAELG